MTILPRQARDKHRETPKKPVLSLPALHNVAYVRADCPHLRNGGVNTYTDPQLLPVQCATARHLQAMEIMTKHIAFDQKLWGGAPIANMATGAHPNVRLHNYRTSADCAQHLPDANLVTDCVLEKLYDSWPETIRSDGPGNPIGLHARDMHY